MKGSIDGGVYYKIHERERLSLEKSVFTKYVPTRVYMAHLKKHSFFRLISINSSTILVVVPLHVRFRGALDHPTQAVSRGN